MTRPAAMIAGLIVASAMVSLGAQSKAKPYGARTPWGDPDLQGTWDYRTITPLERPAEVRRPRVLHRRGGARRSKARAGRSAWTRRPTRTSPTEPRPRAVPDRSGPLGRRRPAHVADRRSAGRPHAAADARRRSSARRAARRRPRRRRRRPRDRPQHHERCITCGLADRQPARRSTTTTSRSCRRPGYVAIVHEMIHETRDRPARRPAALSREDPAVDRRLARPLGRRHARRRDDELQRQDELPRRPARTCT